MRIALCQIDPTVGDFEGNLHQVLASARRASGEGADLAVFPELALCGYPPRDLLDRPSFVQAAERALERLCADAPPSLAVLVGSVLPAPPGSERPLRNVAALVRAGRLDAVVAKRLLPTYDVFDEARHFEPGGFHAPIEVAGRKVGVTICEDLWSTVDGPLRLRRYRVDPVDELLEAGADLLVNLSASPFTLPKWRGRPEMLAAVARLTGRPLVFVNQVGGNDELIFDGDSAIWGPQGDPIARLARFEPDFAVVDLAGEGPRRPQPATEEDAALAALQLGLRDYYEKCRFEGGVVLGLSGGIDSALVACIAARALGPERVLALGMPSRYSSEGSVRDARALANALGIGFRMVPIEPMFEAAERTLLPELPPANDGDVTFENVQARLRGLLLMAFSNRSGRLLLGTGNKSELAVGYCTLYGDMAAGLAVVADVPKTLVYRLAREVNRQAGTTVIPEAILTKPPSAELRPGQRDRDSLPPYDLLDPVLEGLVERGLSPERLAAEGFERSLVERVAALVRRAEHKRRQMPPGLILTRKAFGPGRRVPVAHRFAG